MRNIELHLHTDAYYSGGGDGAQTVVEAIDAASRAGAEAVAITDHGNCANWVDFFNYANGGEVDHTTLEKKGLKPVKPILGVEAYVSYPEKLIDEKEQKEHLLLLAKDYEGFKQISRFVADTNRNIDEKGRPVATFDMLEHHFGGGHVICSSACIAGVLATPLLYNARIDKEYDKVNRRIEKTMELLGGEYLDAKRNVDIANSRIEETQARINKLMPISKKTYAKTEKSISKEPDEEKRQLLLDYLNNEKAETELAKQEIAELKEEIKLIKDSIKPDKNVLSKAKGKLETIEKNNEILENLDALRKSEEELIDDAVAEAKRYKDLFGEDFYAELQYHGIDKEAYCMPIIAQIASDLGIDCIVTNDVHMANKGDVHKRELIRNAANLKQPWSPAIDGDDELYYKTDDEKIEMLTKILPKEVVLKAVDNVAKIADICNVEKISEAHHYPHFDNDTEHLRELALTGSTTVDFNGKEIEIKSDNIGALARYGSDWNEALQKRFDYEMDVIDKMGFSSYFLFIADVLNKCKTARDNATDIGPARGSGAGSIVCFMSGITELDPIKYDLLFERFLNPHRVSMPDIDSDFSKFARQYAIDYVTQTYGQKSVAGIMTKAKMGAKSALTYAPKLYAKEQGLELQTYAELGAKLRKYCTELNTSLSDIEEDVMKDFANNKDALTIFEYAKMLEGTITSYGQHAAGLIAIMDGHVEDYIPLMMAADPEGNEKLVIQADMVAAEAQLGFIKFDFLGLKNLNVITACQQMVYERYGVKLDTYHLPLDDKNVYKHIYEAGFTNFVFQVESDGMRSMLKDLKPSSIGDIILGISVYRPGPMDFIPDIIECKNTGKDSEIVNRFPMLKEVLAETYGYPVYQEQVMKIMTICAGFDLGHADNVRRFMSKKKEDKLAAEKPLFIEGCVKNGTATKEDAEWLFDQLMPFAKYGFNKSHAAAYALVSYITAYFKEYYPKEYLCAAMLEQGDKTVQLQNDCKALGIEILPVNINKSKENYSVEDYHSIRMGLSAIKGLKNDAETIVRNREEQSQYFDVADFVERSGLPSDGIKACILSGACDNLIKNREKAVSYAANLGDMLKKIDEAKSKIELYSGTEKYNEAKVEEWTLKKEEFENQAATLDTGQIFSTDDRAKRKYEMEYLGMYLSGSPLDGYDLSNPKYKSFTEVEEGYMFNTLAVITDYHEITTKNGDRMAFVSLLDKDSNKIGGVIFPQKFEELGGNLDTEMVVEVYGRMELDRNDELQVNIYKAEPAVCENHTIHINVESLERYFDIQDKLIAGKSDYGLDALVRLCGRETELEFKLSEEITGTLDEEDIEYSVY